MTAFQVWWRLARPFSLTASAVPVLVGGGLALAAGRFDGLTFALLLIASLIVQVATNIFNEYYDYRRGLDTPESVGIAGVIVSGQVRAEAVLRSALVCFVVAFALGLWLVARTGWPVLAVGLLCALSAWAYSGGPRPVAYTPLGEVQVFVFMGLIQVGLGYYVHTGTLAWPALWAALPVGCLVAAILLANNLRDQASDAARGRRTLPIVLGRASALRILVALLAGAYVTLVAGVALGQLPWPALLAWLTAPLAPGVVQPFGKTTAARALNITVRRAAVLHLRFGLLLALGLAVAAALGG
jgi:1,4-dihydroxy-2-naphthoate octaprenyltransferase